ncbi:MAG: pentapeptide repeat-containing protein, partial [Hydrococcus sp. SU_1_0]|nr:pentapeptide repeat-containing protein [Hydrococcus sp. SU_1_0]
MGNKKQQRSLKRIFLAIGGTTALIGVILAVEAIFGGVKSCHR